MALNGQITDGFAANDTHQNHSTESTDTVADPRRKKPVQRAAIPPDQRLLIDRRHAAQYLSISQRSLDYLLAHGELNVRRIGSRVLIPLSELQRYARIDHRRLVG
jgi:excisionase family DNA binding protein